MLWRLNEAKNAEQKHLKQERVFKRTWIQLEWPSYILFKLWFRLCVLNSWLWSVRRVTIEPVVPPLEFKLILECRVSKNVILHFFV
jgi:hypothetical protein